MIMVTDWLKYGENYAVISGDVHPIFMYVTKCQKCFICGAVFVFHIPQGFTTPTPLLYFAE